MHRKAFGSRVTVLSQNLYLDSAEGPAERDWDREGKSRMERQGREGERKGKCFREGKCWTEGQGRGTKEWQRGGRRRGLYPSTPNFVCTIHPC